MALPKAVLCILSDEPADHPAEAALRSVGFATFSITWKELDAHPNGWAQLLSPLDDPAVIAWAIVGTPGDFTEAIRSKIAMLTFAMEREMPPATALVLTRDGDFQDVPHAMGHIHIYRHTQNYAAKLMAAKLKPRPFTPLPFYVKAHLDPLIGAWLEVAPPDNEKWDGFMIGVTKAKVVSFGVGSRGMIPSKSILRFPLLGIEGSIGASPFSACAAKNKLSPEISCYMRLDGDPATVFCAEYPDEDRPEGHIERLPTHLELV